MKDINLEIQDAQRALGKEQNNEKSSTVTHSTHHSQNSEGQNRETLPSMEKIETLNKTAWVECPLSECLDTEMSQISKFSDLETSA